MKKTKSGNTKFTILKNCRSNIIVPKHLHLIVRQLATGKARKYRRRGIKKRDFVSPGCREVN